MKAIARYALLISHLVMPTFYSLGVASFADIASAQSNSFQGRNLAGQNYSGRNLDKADFRGAILRGVSFRGASLRGANFGDADLRGASLQAADLTAANLRGAILSGAADQANFSNADLEGANVQNASFAQADFSGANLNKTRGWGDITRARFGNARLAGADFSAAFIRSCSGPLFASTNPDHNTRWPAWLTTGGSLKCSPEFPPAAIIMPERASPASPPADRAPAAIITAPPTSAARPATVNATVNASRVGSGRDLRIKKFAGQTLEYEDFRAANLAGVDLSRANLKGSDFRYADLRGANLRGAVLVDADLTGANMTGAELERARFVNAKMARAILEDQTLHLIGSRIFIPSKEKLGFEASNPNLVDRNNGNLTLTGAILRNARIIGDLEGVDLRRADLRGADLSQVERLDKALLRGAIYDSRTRWNIDPDRAGCVRGEDIPVSLSFFHGSWVIQGKTPNDLELIDVFPDLRFEWLAEGKKALTGHARPTKAQGASEPALMIQGGDAVWTLARSPDKTQDLVTLISADGSRVMKGRRSSRTAK